MAHSRKVPVCAGLDLGVVLAAAQWVAWPK